MFTLGADPEMFLSSNGVPISVIGKLGGSKDRPRKVRGGFVQEDGVAAEFNIMPAQNKEKWIARIVGMRDAIPGYVKARTGLDCSILESSFVVFPKRELEDWRAWEIGCEPDISAYEPKKRSHPCSYGESPARCAGGHIHIGSEIAQDDPITLVKVLDATIGVWSVLIDPNSRKRMQMYGKAGSFRFKPYGIEYRVPSNMWIFETDKIAHIWDRIVDIHEGWEWYKKRFSDHFDKVRDVVNTGNIEEAKHWHLTFGMLGER